MNIIGVNFFFLIFCFVANSCYSQTHVADSLINLVRITQNDSQKVTLYGDIAWELLPLDIAKSQFYTEKELTLALEIKNDALIAQAESDMGNILNRKGNFDSAIVYYLKAVELRHKLKQPIKEAGIYNNIAAALVRQNKFKEAIDINFISLKIFEEANDIAKQASILGNIGNIYYQLEQNTQAYNYFRRGLILAKESGNQSLVANSLVNIGGIKYETNELDSALFYFYEAEKILTNNNLLYNLGATYNNIGKTLATKNEFANAIEYYKKGLENRIQFEDEYGVALSNLNLGGLYVNQMKYHEAINYLQKSELVFKKNHSFIELKDCYFQMAKASELNGDLNSAINYYKLWSEYKDSVYTKESSKQLLEMNAKYETEKKEQENLILTKENELQQLTLEVGKQNRHNLIWFFSISILFIIVLFLLLFNRFRLKKKAEVEMHIAEQKRIGFEAVIDAEENERIRIAKDLHDGIGQQISALSLNFQMLSEEIGAINTEMLPDIEKMKRMIADAGADVRTISHQMMPRALTEFGLIDALEDMIDKSFANGKIQCHFEHHNMEERLPQNIEIGLYRIAQELINNILKHADANQVEVQLVKKANHCILIIQDNGKGIDTAGKKGIGIQNINSRLHVINGELNLESDTHSGTTAIVRIDLSKPYGYAKT